MAAKKPTKAKPKQKRGRPEEPLVIEGDWEAAVAQSLKKIPPPPTKRAGRKA